MQMQCLPFDIIHENDGRNGENDYQQKQPPEVFYKKKMFLNISQNLQENTSARISFLIKLHASGLVFPCEICEIFKNTFLQNSSRRVLLYRVDSFLVNM